MTLEEKDARRSSAAERQEQSKEGTPTHTHRKTARQEIDLACRWCSAPIMLRADGGKPKRFCCEDHRRLFAATLRRYAEALVIAGEITVQELRLFASTGKVAASAKFIITAEGPCAPALDEAKAQ